MDGKQLFPTSEGTPRVGSFHHWLILPPRMEERIKSFVETCDIRRSNRPEYQAAKSTKRSSISLIRYADDFVILHEDITVVQRCKEIISEWLMGMGLELKPSKTRLTHSMWRRKPGFNFLGVNIVKHPVGKYTTGKGTKGEPLDPDHPQPK